MLGRKGTTFWHSGFELKAGELTRGITGKDYGQAAQALAGGGEDRIVHRSADNGCRSLANTTWSFCVLNQVRLHHRHLVDTHRQIAVEIALLDASVLESD
jgi:hypothetical protein